MKTKIINVAGKKILCRPLRSFRNSEEFKKAEKISPGDVQDGPGGAGIVTRFIWGCRSDIQEGRQIYYRPIKPARKSKPVVKSVKAWGIYHRETGQLVPRAYKSRSESLFGSDWIRCRVLITLAPAKGKK